MPSQHSLALSFCVLSCLVAPAVQAEPAFCTPNVDFGSLPNSTAPLVAAGQHFRDQAGRAVLLRGVNATGDAKVPPFTALTSASMLDPLPDWGFNALRLLFTWEAFEPAPCQYNWDYLDYYEEVLDWAHARHLYVVVDFHQDAYSRFSIGGCGEGFPAWAVPSSVELAEPKNDESCASWGTTMIVDLPHHNSWSAFHSDEEGARSRYLDMVEVVASRVAHHPNVVGYEVLNEPWGNDTELAAFYQDVGDRIRTRHPSAIVFVPPHALVSSGLAGNNIAPPTYGNFVYSPHYYDGGIITFNSWSGWPVWMSLGGMYNKANSWGVPMVLGEFGAPPDAGNGPAYIATLYNWLDEHFVSSFQWSFTPNWTPETFDGWNSEDFSIIDDSGLLRANYAPRPYPQKVAGTPIAFSLDATGLEFSWQNTPGAGATELYLPVGYAAGRTLSASAGLSCTLQTTRLRCAGAATSGEVQVVLE